MRFASGILILALAACQATDRPQAAFEQVSQDPVVQGKRLALVLGCVGCHGENLAGEDWSDPAIGRLWTANLTQTARQYTDAQFRTAMTTGRRPDGSDLWEMPAHLFTKLTDEEFASIIAYVRSRPVVGPVHPRATLEPPTPLMVQRGEYESSAATAREEGKLDPPDAEPGHEQARHIVRATCAECHGLDLKGGQPPFGGTPRPDIRMMAASYSAEDFDRLLTKGIASGGRELDSMTGVSRNRYVHLTPTERRAVHAYLKALGEQAAR